MNRLKIFVNSTHCEKGCFKRKKSFLFQCNGKNVTLLVFLIFWKSQHFPLESKSLFHLRSMRSTLMWKDPDSCTNVPLSLRYLQRVPSSVSMSRSHVLWSFTGPLSNADHLPLINRCWTGKCFKAQVTLNHEENNLGVRICV